MFALRAWRQHPGTDKRLDEARARLRLSMPPWDWREVWALLQTRATEALNAIREEIDRAPAA
jgi:hypothetical protein